MSKSITDGYYILGKDRKTSQGTVNDLNKKFGLNEKYVEGFLKAHATEQVKK